MADYKDTGDRIAYLEQMVNAYDDKLEKEMRYKQRVIREKQTNKSKAKIYIFLTIVFFAILIGSIFVSNVDIEASSDSGGVIAAAMESIFIVVGRVISAFAGIAVILCGWKCIHYSRRWNKEIDVKDFQWRTYGEMLERSEVDFAKTTQERMTHFAELETERRFRDERIANQMIEKKDEEDDNRIEMSELFYLKENAPAEKVVDYGNPLAKTWKDE